MDAAKSVMAVSERGPMVIETGAVALRQKLGKTDFAWQVHSKPKVAVIITHHNYSHFVEAAVPIPYSIRPMIILNSLLLTTSATAITKRA